jgi:uncharacterized membrane protein YphA (DoxX/SURF4 family)
MNAKIVGYWICTVLLVFVFLPGGIVQVMHKPQTVEGFAKLGFPLYFVLFLGVWKILGGIAIAVPGFGLLKEWAYAGMLFDLTGAAVANAATGSVWWHVASPLVICGILYGSWALRPSSRRVAG